MTDPEEKFPQERRRAPRISGAVVEYSIKGEDPQGGEKKKAFIKDVCIYGVCIYTVEAIPKQAILDINIFLFGSDIPVKAQGRVAWHKTGDYAGYHSLGIEFVEMIDEDRNRLEEHIKVNTGGDV